MYAAKVLDEDNENSIYYFNNEINILKSLNSPYIINYLDSGTESISKDNKTIQRKYLILEYAENYDLFSYIWFTKAGFGEKYTKLLFYKILKGVEAFHNAGICHRDLKTENILVDENYNLKICDFGFSTSNTGHLKESCGTEGYKAPEVEKENPNYDGIKADIFSLGVVLFTLVTGVNGFDKKNKLYRFIRIRNYDTYWKSVEGALKVFPKDFKELYNRMVCYNPKKRLSVKDILNEDGKKTDYDWLKEIRDLNKDDFASLEEEVKNELKKRKIEVRKGKQKEENKESEDESNIEVGGENKSITDEKVYFDLF
jgi:serine/threonine protein kinase